MCVHPHGHTQQAAQHTYTRVCTPTYMQWTTCSQHTRTCVHTHTDIPNRQRHNILTHVCAHPHRYTQWATCPQHTYTCVHPTQIHATARTMYLYMRAPRQTACTTYLCVHTHTGHQQTTRKMYLHVHIHKDAHNRENSLRAHVHACPQRHTQRHAQHTCMYTHAHFHALVCT